jgi:hypothetical protein
MHFVHGAIDLDFALESKANILEIRVFDSQFQPMEPPRSIMGTIPEAQISQAGN